MLDKLFYFISFAKKTNKQKERWRGRRNSCGQLQRARILLLQIIIKKKQEILKNKVIQEKLQLRTTSYWTRQGTSTITF